MRQLTHQPSDLISAICRLPWGLVLNTSRRLTNTGSVNQISKLRNEIAKVATREREIRLPNWQSERVIALEAPSTTRPAARWTIITWLLVQELLQLLHARLINVVKVIHRVAIAVLLLGEWFIRHSELLGHVLQPKVVFFGIARTSTCHFIVIRVHFQ